MSHLTQGKTAARPSETRRALSVPRRRPDPAGVAQVRASVELGDSPLTDVQAEALYEATVARGLLLPLGVGHGKTLVSLALPPLVGAQRPLYLCPAGLRAQYLSEARKWSSRFRIRVGAVRSYEELSQPGSVEALETLAPDLIICDEAHRLKIEDSARTRRLLRYVYAHDVRLVLLSGSFTTQALEDFAHLAAAALGDECPLPRNRVELGSWSLCSGSRSDFEATDVERVEPLWETYPATGGTVKERTRQALYQHLSTSRGVVMTTESAVKTSLVIIERRPAVPKALDTLIRDVLELERDPDGNYFEHPGDAVRVAKQLVQGFWYSWSFEGLDPGLVARWRWARSRWGSELRAYLRETDDHDSPALVERAIERGDIKGPLADRYHAWQLVEPLVDPVVVTHWIDGYLVRHAVQWARMHRAALVWYADQAVADMLEIHGLRVARAGDVPTEGQTWAVSIKAHGTGLNLQAWSRALILAPPSSGGTFEQLLGRLHRLGQEADEVVFEICLGHRLSRRALKRAQEDAAYTQTTTGQPQKLLLATYLNPDAPDSPDAVA